MAACFALWFVTLSLPAPGRALTGTMAVAAYQHILTAGLKIYVLELVALCLGGSRPCCSSARVVSPSMRGW